MGMNDKLFKEMQQRQRLENEKRMKSYYDEQAKKDKEARYRREREESERRFRAYHPGEAASYYGSSTQKHYVKNGKGYQKLVGGNEYEGNFKNDKFHGKGTYRWKDGTYYKGMWANDKRHGKGVESYPDGLKYEGTWVNGNRHGEFIVTRQDGRKEKLIYNNGEVVEKMPIDGQTKKAVSQAAAVNKAVGDAENESDKAVYEKFIASGERYEDLVKLPKKLKDKYFLSNPDYAFPDGILGIPEGAFKGCTNLKSIRIPKTAKQIGKNAFADCYHLESVVIEDGVECIKDNAFSCCFALKTLRLPETLKELGSFAFSRIKVESIDFPDTLGKIGNYAFSASGLEKVTFPGNIEIGENAFRENKLKSVVFRSVDGIKLSKASFAKCEEKLDSESKKAISALNREAFKKSGCYVASRAYGTADCAELSVLRRYRDEVLMNSMLGRAFVRFYYVIGPIIIDTLGCSVSFNTAVRKILDRIVRKLSLKMQ